MHGSDLKPCSGKLIAQELRIKSGQRKTRVLLKLLGLPPQRDHPEHPTHRTLVLDTAHNTLLSPVNLIHSLDAGMAEGTALLELGVSGAVPQPWRSKLLPSEVSKLVESKLHSPVMEATMRRVQGVIETHFGHLHTPAPAPV